MLSYYEQEKAGIREEFLKAVKDENISLKKFKQALEQCHTDGTIPQEYFSLILETGVLQLIIWAHEAEMNLKP